MSNYTLKIHWTRHDAGEQADETRLFIPADELHVHGEITDDSQMKSWDDNKAEYLDYRWVSYTEKGDDWVKHPGRLIQVIAGERDTWYIATNAWLLGPDGGTIERVAP